VETDPVDATELAETLGFLRDWAATDHDTLNTSLRAFLGTDGYTIDDLRHDLARFTFRLRGDDGEALFTDHQP
jgi:hypothetical protein